MVNEEKFTPSTQWMEEHYNKFNEELFGGRLGSCRFEIFTSGKGSQGGTLGIFRMQGRGLKYETRTRQLFIQTSPFNTTPSKYINHHNFVDLCVPTIGLNGNYKAPQSAWENTLVHEMCHYYTYMDGKCPKQGHGSEFRSIGSHVSAVSRGRFVIERLTDTYDEGFELSSEMASKKATKRMAIVVYKPDGQIRLIMTTSQSLKSYIILHEHEVKGSVSVFSNNELIAELIRLGYNSTMKKYRFWDLTKLSSGKEAINTIEKYKPSETYGDRYSNITSKTDSKQEKEENLKDYKFFSDWQTSSYNGEDFRTIYDGNGYNLIDREFNKTWGQPLDSCIYDNGQWTVRVGRFTYEGCPRKWKLVAKESRNMEDDIKNIVLEEIQKLLKEKIEDRYFNERISMDNNFGEITPDMNLSEIDLD